MDHSATKSEGSVSKFQKILVYTRAFNTNDPISVKHICQKFRIRRADVGLLKAMLVEEKVSFLNDY